MADMSEKRQNIIESTQRMALEKIAHPAYFVTEEADVMQIPDASVSQQITRLLGTDDWVIVHSGHQLVTDEDLDAIEAASDQEVA